MHKDGATTCSSLQPGALLYQPKEHPCTSCVGTLFCAIYNLTGLRVEVIYPYTEFYAHIHVHVCTYTFPHTSSQEAASALSALSNITVTEVGPAVLYVLQLQCSQPEPSQQSCSGIWLQTSPVKKIISRAGWGSSPFGVRGSIWIYTSKSTPPRSWDNYTPSCLIKKWTKPIGKSCLSTEYLISNFFELF